MVPMPAREQRCASHISISSGDDSPGPRRPSIISISSEDESPRPTKKRRVEKGPEKPKAKDNDHGSRSDEELSLEMHQMELMQKWVDDGIQIAIDEMNGGVMREEKLPQSVKPPIILRDPPQIQRPLLPGPSAATPHYKSPYNSQSTHASRNPSFASQAVPLMSYPPQPASVMLSYSPKYQGYSNLLQAPGAPPQYQLSSQSHAHLHTVNLNKPSYLCLLGRR